MERIFNLLPHLAHTALSFFIIISVIVFVHEFGHYFIARLCGVRVEAFAIGFGRELLGRNDSHGTRWKLCALPIGGYVKMYGDSNEASTPDNAALSVMTDAEKQVAFHYKPLWRKAAIVAGGPVANFILTIGILTWFIFTTGLPTTEPIVGDIIKDTPAEAAHLQKNDRVLSVNGEKVELFSDIPRLIATNLGTPVTLEIERGDKILTQVLTPKWMEDEDALGNKYKRPLIGFKSLEMKYQDVGLARAVGEAVRRTYQLCATTLHAMGQMVSGHRSLKEIRGPLGIAKMSGQATEKGVNTILWFIAMLSANLGLFNLFPIPMLDGGHLAFYAIEATRGGKPLAIKIQEYSMRVGMALLAMLMAFSLLNDVKGLWG